MHVVKQESGKASFKGNLRGGRVAKLMLAAAVSLALVGCQSTGRKDRYGGGPWWSKRDPEPARTMNEFLDAERIGY